MQAGEWLAGGDRVAVLDEPFDQYAALRRHYLLGFAPGHDLADDRASSEAVADFGFGGFEDAGERGDQQPPSRGRAVLDGVPMLLDQVARRVEVIGSLQRQRLDVRAVRA